jgi:glycosidase
VPYFFGAGGFRDVAERLDEIAALGATAIWLSPITASPEDDFGYAVKDHFSPREGRLEDLLSGRAVRLDPQAPAVRLPPYGSVVLRTD